MLANADLILNDEALDNVVGGMSLESDRLADVNDLVLNYGDNVSVGENAIYDTRNKYKTTKLDNKDKNTKNKRLKGFFGGGSFDVTNIGRC